MIVQSWTSELIISTTYVFLCSRSHLSTPSQQWTAARSVLLGSLDGTMARVFVGDLSYDTTDNQLRAQYEEYGVVVDAQVQLLAARCCKNKN